jgi:putative ABC transport system substrate-binding protein
MKRKKRLILKNVLLVLSASLLITVMFLNGCGGPKKKTYHVGILSGLEVFATTADGFKIRMKELGYKEGENIIYDFQEVYDDKEKMQKVFDKFVADKVDLIFTYPTEPAIAAKAATLETNIPVVFAMGTIEGNNLIKNIRQPGGNVTGIRYSGPGLFTEYLEILLELAPWVKRVWLTYDPDYPAIPSTLNSLQPAASSAGVTLVKVPVKRETEIEADLSARAKLNDIGIDAILMVPGISHAPASWEAIRKFAAEHKLPIAGGPAAALNQGETVFTYMPDNIEVGKLSALLVDKILKGTPAGTIPVITPEPHLRINYKTAKKLGLKVPEGLLSRAEEIIH